MDQLTRADLLPAAIDARRAAVAECNCQIGALAIQMLALEAEMSALQDRRVDLERGLLWQTLMAEATATDEGSSAPSIHRAVCDALGAAVVEFQQSLVEPKGYAADACAESSGAEPLPYCDTDDYADLARVAEAAEDIADDAREALEAESAYPPPSTMGSFGSKTNRTSGPQATARAPVGSAALRRRAMLRLLTLALHVGRIEQLCGFAAIPDPANVPTAASAEVKEAAVNAWHAAVYEPQYLTAEEQEEWRNIAECFLGPPFSSPPA